MANFTLSVSAGVDWQKCLALLLIAGLAGCASVSPEPGDLASLTCQQKLEYADQMIAIHELRDVSASPVTGFLFLRANRNSVLMGKQVEAALAQGSMTVRDVRFADWIKQMRALDRVGREDELRNLPKPLGIDADTLEECAEQMSDALTVSELSKLSKAVFVPDDYLDFQRIAGFYPITAFGAYFGYEGWKQDNLGGFELPVDALMARSESWVGYGADEVARAGGERDVSGLAGIHKDAFGRWLPDAAALENLARLYLPEFRVNVQSDSDRIGMPSLPKRGALARIDTKKPVVFYRLGHTYLAGEWYAQITYSVWFPERPATGMFDILAGHLDALMWRVTLDQGGKPLIADSIHGCGCYHLFFPSNDLVRIHAPEDGDIRESAETPAGHLTADVLAKPVLWVDATSHYLLAVTRQTPDGANMMRQSVELRPEQELTSLPLEDGSGFASLYDQDGFVPGTDRLERFILWPMGVERPGAMRQWGHHATAFVGRRHFDDPMMFNRYFEPAE
jgi:hypothetical protein